MQNRVFDEKKSAQNFSKLLQFKTVAGNEEAFVGFHAALKDLYPNIYKTCAFEVIYGKGLMYTWKGSGDGDKSVVLMSHYDVVPADVGDWKYPPYSGTIADGKIWSRGTLDTKGTFCSVMESVENLIADGFTPNSDIYLCFGGDEETTHICAQEIAAELKRRGVRPYLVLDEGGAVVDGTMIGINHPFALIGIAEKGYADVEFITSGGGGHSSSPPKNNPIVTMAEVITRLNAGIFKTRISRPVEIMMATLSENISSFNEKLSSKNLPQNLAQVDALTKTIGSITMISGGSATNTIAERVRAVGNFRIISGSSVEETMSIIKDALMGLDVEINVLTAIEPSIISEPGGEGFEAVSKAVAQTWDGAKVVPYLMIARSDSASYSVVSDNIYRLTPTLMSHQQFSSIHGVNENITEEDFFKMIDFYVCLVRQL